MTHWSKVLALLVLVGCSGETPEASPTPTVEPATPTVIPEVIPNLAGPFPYEKLSDYGFFRSPMKTLEPGRGVYGYEVISPLYSDHALKRRFIVLPEGQKIGFTEDERWSFPDKTILVKNFAFAKDMRDPSLGEQLIETRLLILENGVWTAHTYRWNEEQTEATNLVAGAFLTLSYVDMAGLPVEQLYQIPNTVQCKNCHGSYDVLGPIGARTRQLNRMVEDEAGQELHQLEWLAGEGVFSEPLPAVASLPALASPAGQESLDRRARSYLESNCAHCHQPGGAGGPSGLVLTTDETVPMTYGICKPPVAAGPASAGLHYDIVPGSPDESIMVYRISSSEPQIKMPELGNLTVDPNGLQLIRDWISAMEPPGCPQ
ncbi:MAG: SO2930 family diheme c-type cytochrome [Myxococcota bacterium]